MSDVLTKRQKEVLEFIQKFYAHEGIPPSIREIGNGMKISINAVMCYLRALVTKGALEKSDGVRSRSYVPIQRRTDVVCPHCGNTIEAVEDLT